MSERAEVIEVAGLIAAAIGARNVGRLRELLAPGFVHRTHGDAAGDTGAFLRAVEQIPGEIISVRLEQVEVDFSPAGALVTGLQHAQVRIDGQTVDDRRRFVDWFVKHDGQWRIQAAVDVPYE
jgi:hypothetical protein